MSLLTGFLTSRGSVLFLSDPQVLASFSKKIIQLEEGTPAVLRLMRHDSK
ncbi:hypothetical protein BGS_0338 [Beggiatoa sp. SS]|nr:hypothetical protein BGS_0338 [Beggiatoa sp. SS]